MFTHVKCSKHFLIHRKPLIRVSNDGDSHEEVEEGEEEDICLMQWAEGGLLDP